MGSAGGIQGGVGMLCSWQGMPRGGNEGWEAWAGCCSRTRGRGRGVKIGFSSSEQKKYEYPSNSRPCLQLGWSKHPHEFGVGTRLAVQRSQPSQSSSSISCDGAGDAEVAADADDEAASLSPTDCYLCLVSPPPGLGPQKNDAEQKQEVYYSLGEKKFLRVNNKHNNRLREDLSNTRCLGSSRGWLFFLNRLTISSYLVDPFFPNPPIVPLPPIESLPDIVASFRRRIRRPPSSSSSYSSSSSSSNEQQHSTNSRPRNNYKYRCEFLMSGDHLEPIPSSQLIKNVMPPVFKFAVSSPVGPPGTPTVVMVAVFGRLAFCSFGDTAWTTVWELNGNHNSNKHRLLENYLSLVYSQTNRRFYALSEHGIEAWDLTDPSFPRRTFFNDFWERDLESYGNKYLISDSGDLWMAVKQVDPIQNDDHNKEMRTQSFDIFKLDFTKGFIQMERVKSLGDRALFLDHNQSALVSVVDFPKLKLKPNSIYFTDDTSDLDGNYVGHDMGISSFGENSTHIEPYYPPGESIGEGAFWVIPVPFPPVRCLLGR